MDILFRTEDYVFSYRVAGICIRNGKLLLQKPCNDSAFAFPGGHVSFGETNAETLAREFREEIGADIAVRELKWVGELFFPWGKKPCHQLCLYYAVELLSDSVPTDGMFPGTEQLEGRAFTMEYHWIPLEKLGEIEVYPTNAAALMSKIEGGTQHFIYRE